MAEEDFIKPATQKKGFKDRLLENKNYLILFGVILVAFTVFVFLSEGTSTLYKGFIGEEVPGPPPSLELEEDEPVEDEPVEEEPEEVVEEDNPVEEDPGPPPTLELPEPATINTLIPNIGETEVDTDAGLVTVIFNETDLSFDSEQDITIMEIGESGDISSPITTFTVEASTLQISYPELKSGTNYNVQIPAATIKNGTISLASDITWTFTTAEEEVEEEPEEEEDDAEIRIIEVNVTPQEFNPMINEARISFEISDRAEVDIRIQDTDNHTVVELLEGETLNSGESFVWWNGSDEADSIGNIVDSGIYQYKISARNPETGELEDSKTGLISAKYETVSIDDFEGPDGIPTPAATTQNVTTTQSDPVQTAATLSLQNSNSGVTAQTGPGILIYLLFPLGSLALFNKK